MTPQELKASILQLAIQGKLVEQRPEEGTGAELLEKILATKNTKATKKNSRAETRIPQPKAVREADALAGVRRGEKADSLPPREEIPDDEKPFDIPESWEWVRLGDVFNLQAGKNIKSEEIHQEYSPEHKYKCYGGNGCRGYVADYNRTGHHVLIGRQGALCGNINYAEGDFYATEHAVVVEQFAGTDVYWCGYFLDALNLNRYATATAQPGLAVAKINHVLIPLPPLAEQKRIVAKIEELLPLIDRYEKAWSKLEDFNKRFPVDMQKSLLQMAIQGKLVEQRAEEGTAAELLEKILAAKNAKGAKKNSRAEPRIPQPKAVREADALAGVRRGERGEKADAAASFGPGCPVSPSSPVPPADAPFDIPESWVWVRLGELVSKEIKRGKSPVYTPHSGTLVFAQKCNTKAGHIDLSLAQCLDEKKLDKYPLSEFMKNEDIVINSTGNGTLGRVGIYHNSDNPNNLPVVPDSHVTVIRVSDLASVQYVFYGLKYYQPYMEKLGSGSTNQTELSASTLKKLLFPLPPLAEQKRIVAKLEELLPLCEQLK